MRKKRSLKSHLSKCATIEGISILLRALERLSFSLRECAKMQNEIGKEECVFIVCKIKSKSVRSREREMIKDKRKREK